jgi:hypothetical protein
VAGKFTGVCWRPTAVYPGFGRVLLSDRNGHETI